MSSTFKQRLGSGLAKFLSRPLPGYRRLDTVTIEQVAAVMKPGDVLLVEGDSRISSAIKYLTQSSWSHACLYCGDMNTPVDEPSLIEADLKDGVRLVSLSFYLGYNLRICRPSGLSAQEIETVIGSARSRIGHQYDLKNIFDLIRYLIQKPPVPNRLRRSMLGFGSGDPTKAICSTLIAQSFQRVDYPILPIPQSQQGKPSNDDNDGRVPRHYRRHFTHFVPRDFDLSPYFDIVKPTLQVGFDFHHMQWLKDPENSD